MLNYFWSRSLERTGTKRLCILKSKLLGKSLKEFSWILRAAFFLSGVFFGAEHIPPEHLDTFLLNPIAVFLEMARAAVLGDMSLLTWRQILRSISFAVIAFIIGSMVFVKSERKAVKFL